MANMFVIAEFIAFPIVLAVGAALAATLLLTLGIVITAMVVAGIATLAIDRTTFLIARCLMALSGSINVLLGKSSSKRTK